MVADKLKRQWLWEVCFGIRDRLQKVTQGGAIAKFILQPQYTHNPHNICASLTWLQVPYCDYMRTWFCSVYVTAKTSWLFSPQSGYPGCRQTGETVVMKGCSFIRNYNCIKQPNIGSCQVHLHNTLTTLRTSVKELLQMHFKGTCNKVRKAQMFWGFSVYCSCKMNLAAA